MPAGRMRACTSRTPVCWTIAATLWARTPPPAITTSASPARATMRAMVAAPAHGGIGATRREHAIDAERQQGLERLDRIARRVDRFVAGHRQRPRHVDQPAHDAGVDRRIGTAARRTRRRGRRPRPPHGCRRPSPRPRRRRRRSRRRAAGSSRTPGWSATPRSARSARRRAWSRPRRGGRTARPVPLPRRPTPARRRANRCRTRRGAARRACVRTALRAGRASRRPAPGRAPGTARAPHRAGGSSPAGSSGR